MKMIPILLGFFVIAGLGFLTNALTRKPVYRSIHLPEVALLLGAAQLLLHAPLPYTDVLLGALRQWQDPTILTLAASLIIFHGGTEIRPSTFLKLRKVILNLATLGVLVSAASFTLLFMLLTHVTFETAWLIGALFCATDPAVLITILDRFPIRDEIQETLIAESALNDPMSAMLVSISIAFAALQTGTRQTAFTLPAIIHPLLVTLYSELLSILIGVAVGLLSRRIRKRFFGSSTTKLLSTFFLAWGLCELTGASPFLAAFLAGVLLHREGEEETPDHVSRGMNIALTLTRSTVFVGLGLALVFPHRLTLYIEGVSAAFILVAFARPLSVLSVYLLTKKHTPLSGRDYAFLAVNRQTGVVPALLVLLLKPLHLASISLIEFSIVAAILITSALEAPFFPVLARRFGVTTRDAPK
ncbi:cation:proton antiporter [Ferroacidibacillus organovorans]|uniref:Cation/H+ exchanger transmembrane domain-containing protein n=1 Tax=Ferroacidibacillus organovorans TaxID=1765683 RepID=A0A101XTU7_9BACL|nr:cation:proton antiporter [Ferroacidibacillus organovorans]KUO97434.1 hypothetical protein ATW55_06105 [Ferroacidibacillus organovorans]